MLYVNQIIRCYNEDTATEPFLAQLSNNEFAVIKYPYNPEGNLVLINEFISYELAKLLQLNTPKCGICMLNENCNILNDVKLSSSNYGYCFYSMYISKAVPFSDSKISKINNKEQFIKLIIFDHLIYNKDRHQGNILISISKQIEMFPIDHSHVFKNQAIWDKNTFIQGMNNFDYLDNDILNNNKSTYDALLGHVKFSKETTALFIEQIKAKLTKVKINDIIYSTPESWLQSVDSQDLEYLEKYIIYRVEHIDQIIDMIIEERLTIKSQ